jgi:hypothetical protein
METIKYLFFNLKYEKKKERFEMILEPFQAITQIALLAYCPIGTKISITNNILYIQQPSYTQPFIRNYNSDKKEDLIYLFTVIKRFHKFYGFLKEKGNKMTELFNTLVENSKIGIDNLVKTYSDSETNHLTQTLRMYKSLLDKPDAFMDNFYDENENENESIDNIFEGLVNLYDNNIYIIILNLFRLLQKNPNDYITYINATESVMSPININIKNWINDKIVL